MKFNYKYIFLAILIFFFFFKVKENFASSSPGALIQLVASGAQDVYLTSSDNGKPAVPVMANKIIY